MPLTLTNLVLILLTLLSAAASVLAVVRLRGMIAGASHGEEGSTASPGLSRWVTPMLLAVALGALGLLGVRWVLGHSWSPLRAHVDGLLLIASLLALSTLYIQARSRLTGLSAFSLPLLSVILAWAVCASAWTYRPFELDTLHPVWKAVHLVGVYVGTLASAVAAVAGVMYLYVEKRVKAKRDLRGMLRVASLESLERTIQQSAGLGFLLLTLGLVSGLVIIQSESQALGPGWWYSPKVVLAFVAWLAFGLLMNVRYASAFRGRRAAWLAIAGLLLLLGVYGLVTAGDGKDGGLVTPSSPAVPLGSVEGGAG